MHEYELCFYIYIEFDCSSILLLYSFNFKDTIILYISVMFEFESYFN